jgi:hypothetical protein
MARFKSANATWRTVAVSSGVDDVEQAEIIASQYAQQMKLGMAWIIEFDVPQFQPVLKLAKVSDVKRG